jgi:hypothetical protein
MVDISQLLNPVYISILGNILAVIVLAAFIVYFRILKKGQTDGQKQQAIEILKIFLSVIESIPDISPEIIRQLKNLVDSLAENGPIPPLPEPPNTYNWPGLSWTYVGNNKVAVLNPKEWVAGGGRYKNDPWDDQPQWFSFGFICGDRFITSNQGYYELETNTLHVIPSFNWDNCFQ